VQQRGKGEYSLATQKSNGEDDDQTTKPKTQNLNNPEPNKETGNGENDGSDNQGFGKDPKTNNDQDRKKKKRFQERTSGVSLNEAKMSDITGLMEPSDNMSVKLA
jgi:hypothetical protein